MDSTTRRARLEEVQHELEWRRCEKDWYYWLGKYVITKDENAPPGQAFKRFPVERLPYIWLLGQLYLHQKLLIILKSRQLMVTWLCCALDLWQAMFKPGRFIPITAYKEEDAADIVDRIELIYRGQEGQEEKAPGLPEWMQSRSPCKRLKEPHQLEFLKMGSLIRALAEGSDQGRGKTISRWRNEESRTQSSLQASTQAVLPTLKEGGGQAVFISSAGAGYFQLLVEDRIDRLSTATPPPRHEYKSPMEGVTLWKNKRNGYYVVRIHYTADPRKRDPRWIARTRSGFADYMWNQEYEIDFGARSGEPGIPVFEQRRKQIVIPPFDIPSNWPVFSGADYGTTNPYCCLFFAVDGDENMYVFWEYYSPGPLGVHLQAIKSHPRFPDLEIYALDRSCWAATQQASSNSVNGRTLHSMRSVADLHQDLGVHPVPAHVERDSVKVQACYREWNDTLPTPKTFIFSTCTNLIRELPEIRWVDKKNPLLNASEKLVDSNNHAFDAFCYGILYHREGPPEEKTGRTKLGANLHRVNQPYSPEEQERILIMCGIAAQREENERQDQIEEEKLDDYYGGGGDTWGLDD